VSNLWPTTTRLAVGQERSLQRPQRWREAYSGLNVEKTARISSEVNALRHIATSSRDPTNTSPPLRSRPTSSGESYCETAALDSV
jgi:hypothetical protein